MVVGIASASDTTRDPASGGIGKLLGSPLGIWSLLRAVLIVVAVVVGYQLTSELDPYWVAIVLLIVFQPDLEQTLVKAAQRGLGTLVGVLTATTLIEPVDTDPLIVVVVAICTFAAIAFYHANYLIHAFVLTNAVLLYYSLAVGPDAGDPGLRLLASIVGIGLALLGLGVLTRLARPIGPGQD